MTWYIVALYLTLIIGTITWKTNLSAIMTVVICNKVTNFARSFLQSCLAMDNGYIARFTSYEDYLDSLIAEEDIRYLQDGELARLIAELSYRGAGRTLTEREYDDEKERIEMAKKLKEINENAEQAGDMLGPGDGDGVLVAAIKQRYKENKEGRMNSLFYLYIKGENIEASGHIDLAARYSMTFFIYKNKGFEA